jgi:Uma2 family endonuclease
MSTVTTLSEQEYRELAAGDAVHLWELWDGVLVEKPPMKIKHDNMSFYLGLTVANQLDHAVYRVNVNGGKTRLPLTYLIPDVMVIPASYQIPHEDDPDWFTAYPDPLPFVAEVWSRSTGNYDVAAKLPRYRERGDQEIWFIHPYDRTLRTWRLRGDRVYAEDLYRGGIVPIESLPIVSVDFDALLRS